MDVKLLNKQTLQLLNTFRSNIADCIIKTQPYEALTEDIIYARILCDNIRNRFTQEICTRANKYNEYRNTDDTIKLLNLYLDCVEHLTGDRYFGG